MSTLSGEDQITHTDSMGSNHSLKVGEVQRMSAGTGITHSEYNHSEKPLHLFQIWIEPDTPALTPSYEQRRFDLKESENNLLPLVSGRGLEGAINIHSDSTIFLSALRGGEALAYKLGGLRAIFIYMIEGELIVNGELLNVNDQPRFEGEEDIAIKGKGESSFIFIDSIV